MGLHGLPVVCGLKYPPCVRICAIIRAPAAEGWLGYVALYVHAGLHACGSCVDPHAHTPRVCGTSKTYPLALPPPKLAFLKAEPRNTSSFFFFFPPLLFFPFHFFFKPFRIQKEMILSDSWVTITHTHAQKKQSQGYQNPCKLIAQSAFNVHAKRGFGGS